MIYSIVLDMFDYVFPENGLIAYKNNALIGHTVSTCNGVEKKLCFAWYLIFGSLFIVD